MAGSLYDYLPLSVLFVFCESNGKFRTQQEVNTIDKKENDDGVSNRL